MRDLSPQQRRVMALVARGMTNKQIGRELGMHYRTVEAHVSRAMKLMSVTNRTQAAISIITDADETREMEV